MGYSLSFFSALEDSLSCGYMIKVDVKNDMFINTLSVDFKLLINEIIESKPPVPNPRGTNALSWIGEGTFNGSTGYYELIIDPESNTVWHFVFKSQ